MRFLTQNFKCKKYREYKGSPIQMKSKILAEIRKFSFKTKITRFKLACLQNVIKIEQILIWPRLLLSRLNKVRGYFSPFERFLNVIFFPANVCIVVDRFIIRNLSKYALQESINYYVIIIWHFRLSERYTIEIKPF